MSLFDHPKGCFDSCGCSTLLFLLFFNFLKVRREERFTLVILSIEVFTHQHEISYFSHIDRVC